VSQQNRIVVFAVGGVININSAITVSANITIAGQTAPGGITIYGNTVAFRSNVICRYVRIHGSINMNSSSYALSAGGVVGGIFDHVSVAWGRWDNMKLDSASTDITFQYCLIGEAIAPQYLGALFEGPKKITVHHTLWANNHSRSPKAKADIEYINNVVYNWGGSGFVGGHSGSHFYQDLINNYFIGGPSSSNSYISGFGSSDHVYHSGNYADTDKNGALNGSLVTDTNFTRAGAALAASRNNVSPATVTIDDAATALQKVIAKAGASDHRDPVDARMIGQLSSYGTSGALVGRESAVGGQPAIAGGIPPADTNSTGIPDWWAEAMGFGAAATSEWAGTVRADGYTNLEFYINSIVTSGVPDVVITGITPSGNSDISAADPLTGGSITNTSTGFAINGTAPAGATVEVSAVDTGPNAATATADGTGNWSLTISSVAERQYAFTARVKRAADDYSLPSAAHAVRVKRTADAAPVIDRFVVSATAKTFSGAATPYSQIAVKVASGPDQSGAVIATADADGYGNWDAITSATFQAADYAFTATATDLAGNTSADSAQLTVAMGIASPVFTGISDDTGTSATDQITTDQTLVFNGTADASATITIYSLDGTVATAIGSPVSADASGDWTFDYTATTLPAGVHTFFATAGSGGSPSPMSAPFVVTIDRTAPTVASINRLTPDTTNTSASTLVFRVTFAEPVTGVAQNNFTVTRTGSGMEGDIAGFTQVDARIYEVTVTSAAGDGTIRVNLASNLGNIKDLAGNAATASYTSGQTYTMRYVGSGVWKSDEAAVWSETTAWEDDAIADGTGATADFGTVDISEETVVSLDSARTLGRLIFADADEESAGTWRIAVAENSPAASITLANPGGATPEIRVTYENAGDGGTQDYDKAANGRSYPVIIDAPFNSSAGFLKTGWGTIQLNNIGAFAGPITVQQGYLKLGPGAELNMTQPLDLPTAGSGLLVAGGTFTTTSVVNMVFNSENTILVSAGRADFKRIVSGNNRNGLIKVTGGLMTADEIMLQRSADGTGGYGNGVVVTGGTATIATLGVGTTNSWGAVSVEGGKLIITGPLWNGWQESSARGGQIRVQGGELVSTDTVDGIVMTRKKDSNGNANNIAELHLIGGIVTAKRIALGYDAAVNAGSATINLNHASSALYIGEKGIVKPGSFTTNINLTNGTLGADDDWSTTVPMTVTGTGSVTIKAASAAGVAHDITLGGALGNSGAITKTGGGTLTLSAVNTHTGPITVNEGTLNVTGRIATGTEVVTINAGATLTGTGAINRPVVLNGGKFIAGAAPLAVASLTKQGTDKVPVTYAPMPVGAGSSRTPIITFTSSNLTNADFEPIVENDRIIYMDVTATGIDQVVYSLDDAGGDSGVSGGGEATIAIATDAAAFKAAIENAAAAVVIVSGEIDLTTAGAVTVASNKTIIGQSAAAVIKGALTLPATTSNVVINGVGITNPAGSGLVLDGAQDVYITHCTFYDCNGTLVSAVNGADNITVSWNEFYYTSGFTGTRSAMKIGAAGVETKPLHVVLDHNYFGEGNAADMPAVNYGYVYMYDNYLHAPGNTTATIVGDNSQVLSAHNVYQDMVDPIVKTEAGLLSDFGGSNLYVSTTGTTAGAADTVFVPVPDHQYVLEPAAVIGVRVPAHAGNTGGASSVTPAAVDVTVSILASGAAVPEGGTFMLAASVVGATPVSYQWNLDNNAIDGARSDTYTVTNANAGLHAGAYSVSVVLGTGETIVSAGSDIQIGESNLPVIVTQPIAQNVRLNDRAVFAVIATSNTPLTYQWYKDGVMIPFATQSSYYQHATLAYNGGVYTVVVTNATGSKTSDGAMLNIVDLPATNSGGGGDSGDGGGGGAPSWWLLGAGVLLMIIRYARKIRGVVCAVALVVAGLFTTTSIQAADGTWSGGGGNWSGADNWSGGVASGVDSTATFSGAGGAVIVDAPVIVGNLAFSSANWTIASSGAGNALKFEVSAYDGTATPPVQPVIDVGTNTVTISAPLDGTQGFTRGGTAGGMLTLTGSSTINGHVLVSNLVSGSFNSGTMSLGAGGYLNLGAGNLRIAGGNTSYFTVTGGTFITTGIVILGGQSQVHGAEAEAPYPRAPGGGLNTNASRMLFSSGYVNVGEIRTASDSNAALIVTGGTLVSGQINVLRNAAGSASYGSGFIVQGGVVEAIHVGVGVGNSNGAMSVESGSVTVSGSFLVANGATSGRGGQLRVTDGRLVSTDTVDGLILCKTYVTATSSNANTPGVFLVSGGVATLEKITLGYDNTMNAGSATVTLSDGALYLGSGGIVKNGASGFNTTITLSGGTLGAKGSWTTTHPIAISGATTILASSEDSTPNDITLDGAVSGAGAITKGGAGTLVLSDASTHTGAITINSGTLVIPNGLGAGTAGITVNSGATLDADGINLGRPMVLAGGSKLVLNGVTPMAVTSLAKSGAGSIQVIFNGTFSDGLPIVTFDTTTLVNVDFAPITLSDGSQASVKVSEGRLELVPLLIVVPNLPDGITGSNGASSVLATTAAELKAALESPNPATVYVNGSINLSTEGGVINVGPGKTIVGQDVTSTISGKLNIPATSGNVIIFGVNITNPAGDGLVIDGAKDVYVTHCTFSDCDGALVSALNGADNLTFAWNAFQYTNTFAGTRSVMKIGAAGAETTLLHAVLHHNYFGAGCDADMPASVNGYIHMYDNYLNAPANTTATIVSANSQLLSEGNVYQDMAAPVAKTGGGLLRVIENIYVDTTGAAQIGEDVVFVPDYPRVLETAATLGADVPLYAGNHAGLASLPPAAPVDAEAVIMATGTTVLTGGGFTLIASVPGYRAQACQWYLNNLPIPGATNSGYSVSDATVLESGPYSVGVTLATGETLLSGATRVTVGDGHRPDIVMQPASIVVARQDTALFTVVASGDGEMRYQWQKNGADIAGATNSLLSLPNVQDADAATYQVIVTNDYGMVTSDAATLTLRGGSGGGEINGGGGGGGAPSWWLPAAMLALASLRAMTTRRRQTR
jgi:autotransporter-associated beta strand protein